MERRLESHCWDCCWAGTESCCPDHGSFPAPASQSGWPVRPPPPPQAKPRTSRNAATALASLLLQPRPQGHVSLSFTLHPRFRAATRVLEWTGALTPPRSSPQHSFPCVSAAWTLLLCFAGPLLSLILAAAEATLLALQEPPSLHGFASVLVTDMDHILTVCILCVPRCNGSW